MKIKDILPAISYAADINVVTKEYSVSGYIDKAIFPIDLIINRLVLEHCFPEILEKEIEGGLRANELGEIIIPIKGE